MKIRKLSPLFVAALLVSCSGNSGITTMKKPSFAKYSNAVSEEDCFKAVSEKNKALMDLFETEGEGDAKTIKGLKNGLTQSSKMYKALEASGKSAAGISMKYKTAMYREEEQKIDKANTRVQGVAKTEMLIQANNGSVQGQFTSVDDGKVLVVDEPDYSGSKMDVVQKSKETNQTEYTENSKAKVIYVEEKAYSEQTITGFDFGKYYASEAYDTIGTLPYYVGYLIPDYLDGDDDIKYYVDGDIVTFFAEKEFNGTAESNGLSYTSKAKVSFIAQINYAKLTLAGSVETNVEQSTKNGNVTVKEVTYATMAIANKDVTVKAIDTSKFTSLDLQ